MNLLINEIAREKRENRVRLRQRQKNTKLKKQEKKVIERAITKVRDVKIICFRQMASLANHL